MSYPNPIPTKFISARGLLSWLGWTVAAVFVAIAGWIRYHFGAVSFEQIVTNLPVGGDGGAGNNQLADEAITVGIWYPVIITTSVAVAIWLWRVFRPRRGRPRPGWMLPMVALGTGMALLLSVAGIPRYVAAGLDSNTIATYYRKPTLLNAPDKPLNLITIYLESIENTYRDEALFGQNFLADLDKATQDYAIYPNLRQDPTGGWTMAGIVGTQCGFPLKSKLLAAGLNTNSLGEKMTSYLPGATCLSDLLAQNGYTNAYVGGAYTRFAGKDTFLKNHAFSSVQGLQDWQAAGEDRSLISAWGLSDKRMFEHAADKLDELRKAGKPFNLTMLTLDSHEPGGVYESCVTDDDIQMVRAIKCSMKAVAGFLNYLKGEGFLNDTLVVVMGDHLKNTGDSDYLRAELLSAPQRTVVFRVHSPNQVSFARDGADQLSVLPTILELLGFEIADGRAGLGVSFAADHDLANTAVALPPDKYRTLLTARSAEIYRQFWQS